MTAPSPESRARSVLGDCLLDPQSPLCHAHQRAVVDGVCEEVAAWVTAIEADREAVAAQEPEWSADWKIGDPISAEVLVRDYATGLLVNKIVIVKAKGVGLDTDQDHDEPYPLFFGSTYMPIQPTFQSAEVKFTGLQPSGKSGHAISVQYPPHQ